MARFEVDPEQVRRLARSNRFVAELVRLAWLELMSTRGVVTKSRTVDPDSLFLDDWDPQYRKHVLKWAGEHQAELQALVTGLAEGLAELLSERTRGMTGGRPHGG